MIVDFQSQSNFTSERCLFFYSPIQPFTAQICVQNFTGCEIVEQGAKNIEI